MLPDASQLLPRLTGWGLAMQRCPTLNNIARQPVALAQVVQATCRNASTLSLGRSRSLLPCTRQQSKRPRCMVACATPSLLQKSAQQILHAYAA